jgi:ribose-phosphate pyrophosphokinase
VTISAIIGDVTDKDIIVIDDEIARGTTLVELLERLREQNARTIRIACTHGLFADGALGKLAAQPDVAEVVCTNTVPMPEHKRDDKLKVLSIAPAMGEAIRRIHNGESISSLFDIP